MLDEFVNVFRHIVTFFRVGCHGHGERAYSFLWGTMLSYYIYIRVCILFWATYKSPNLPKSHVDPLFERHRFSNSYRLQRENLSAKFMSFIAKKQLQPVSTSLPLRYIISLKIFNQNHWFMSSVLNKTSAGELNASYC